MEKLSKANQESYVAQGLALGVLSYDFDELPSDKCTFEFAFQHAWRRFPQRKRFPTVLGHRSADPIHALVGRSERRRGPIVAAWDTEGRWIVPYVAIEGWDVDESGETLANWSDGPWHVWRSLARDFLKWIEPGCTVGVTGPSA